MKTKIGFFVSKIIKGGNFMQDKYQKPLISVLEFSEDDVIRTSPNIVEDTEWQDPAWLNIEN